MSRRSAVGVKNGNFRAGDYYQYALAVQRGWNNNETERMLEKKRMRAMYWRQRLGNAIDVLASVDPLGWASWYDDDNKVSPNLSDREYALLVEARVKELHQKYPSIKAVTRNGIFIWQEGGTAYVFTKEISKHKFYTIEFQDFAEAENFVNSLPSKNIGYGIVLDILPLTI